MSALRQKRSLGNQSVVCNRRGQQIFRFISKTTKLFHIFERDISAKVLSNEAGNIWNLVKVDVVRRRLLLRHNPFFDPKYCELVQPLNTTERSEVSCH